MAEITINTLGIGSRVKHPAFGDGVVIRSHQEFYDICFILYGIKQVERDDDRLHIIDAVPAETSISFTDIEKSLIRVLRSFSDISEVVPLGDKWEGGTMILKPKDDSLKPKDIPIEAFFHKIVMTRDRLRVMEQRINASNLSGEEKVNLQQYITRIYGSLTTFNILFKNKEHYFVGDKSE